MNQIAYDAIISAWELTIKARALCPYTDASAIGMASYSSPGWYQARGAAYFVQPAQPLTAEDVKEINRIGEFVNRSFIISMAAILEANSVVPYKKTPDRTKPGGNHAQLTKRLRHHFAHGEWVYNPNDDKHIKTRQLLEDLFSTGTMGNPGFVVSIDTILEPLKDGVLEYIRFAT